MLKHHSSRRSRLDQGVLNERLQGAVSYDRIAIPLRNWEALALEERWWLYTMTVATTGQALQKKVGLRKALLAAIADNPFIKGVGMSPKARRELLGHSQLTLEI